MKSHTLDIRISYSVSSKFELLRNFAKLCNNHAVCGIMHQDFSFCCMRCTLHLLHQTMKDDIYAVLSVRSAKFETDTALVLSENAV